EEPWIKPVVAVQGENELRVRGSEPRVASSREATIDLVPDGADPWIANLSQQFGERPLGLRAVVDHDRLPVLHGLVADALEALGQELELDTLVGRGRVEGDDDAHRGVVDRVLLARDAVSCGSTEGCRRAA